MILVEYDNESLNEFMKNNINETFKDYINYVKKYYDIKENDEYSYIILTEIKENDKYSYANLRMRWGNEVKS